MNTATMIGKMMFKVRKMFNKPAKKNAPAKVKTKNEMKGKKKLTAHRIAQTQKKVNYDKRVISNEKDRKERITSAWNNPNVYKSNIGMHTNGGYRG